MLLTETFWLALKNIWSNKMRTFLTMLGIIIGVTAVIVIVGLGNGITKSVEESFAAMGTDILQLTVWGRGTSRNISVDGVYRIVDENSDLLKGVSPNIYFSGNVRVGNTTFRYTSVYGGNEELLSMRNYKIAEGRGIQYMDIVDHKQVCVIGDYLAREGFGGDAVGKTIKIGAYKFRIVGVLAPKVESADLQMGGDDDRIYLPYSTAMRLSSTSTVNDYIVTMTNDQYVSQAKAALENSLYNVFQDDSVYYVYSMGEMLDVKNATISMAITVLAVIAGISLVVGGIGIMNIMLVSVTERTREIGIRKALGARESVIMLQFVMEAATTSAMGGVFGILLGYGISSVATSVLPSIIDMTVKVSPTMSSVVVAFGISVGIGVLFGYLPALRAARLNPIEALRYD